MQEIIELITKDRLDEALQRLNSGPFAVDKIEISNLMRRLNNLERDNRMGILSRSDYLPERNKVSVDILKIIKQVTGPDNDVHPESKSENTGNAPQVSDKTKILFIAANPTDQARIQTDKEHRLLKAQLERGRSRDHFLFLHPQFSVTILELIRAMNDKPEIIHFSGHGDRSGICLTTENNETQIMGIPALKRLFRPLAGVAQIVILNACYSSEQAKIISEFGMHVVGNNIAVEDPAAISFSEGFYNGLGEGKVFEEAFNDAMIVVETKYPSAAGIVEVWKDGVKLDL